MQNPPNAVEKASTDSYLPLLRHLLAKILLMAQLEAMQVCKKLDEKPTALEKFEVCRNLNVIPGVGQIRTKESCGARLAGKEQCPFFRSKVTAGLQLLCAHD